MSTPFSPYRFTQWISSQRKLYEELCKVVPEANQEKVCAIIKAFWTSYLCEYVNDFRLSHFERDQMGKAEVENLLKYAKQKAAAQIAETVLSAGAYIESSESDNFETVYRWRILVVNVDNYRMPEVLGRIAEGKF